jgi:hypothetical protein
MSSSGGAIVAVSESMYYMGGFAEEGSTFDGVQMPTIPGGAFDDVIGIVTAIDADGVRTTWPVLTDGWSEVFKLAANEDAVFAQYEGGLGPYPDDSQTGVSRFTPEGTLVWRWHDDAAQGAYGIRYDGETDQLIIVGGTSTVYVTVLDATTGTVKWQWDTDPWSVFDTTVPGPDGKAWAIALDAFDDNYLLLIGPSGLEGSWPIPEIGPNWQFPMPSTDRNVLFLWHSTAPGVLTVWRIDADGVSATVTTVLSTTLSPRADVVSVDPDTHEIFVSGGHPTSLPDTRQAWAFLADGTPKWGPVVHGVEDSNGQNQDLAQNGVFMVFGFDAILVTDPYLAAIAVLAQEDGEILLTERMASVPDGMFDHAGGAVAGQLIAHYGH